MYVYYKLYVNRFNFNETLNVPDAMELDVTQLALKCARCFESIEKRARVSRPDRNVRTLMLNRKTECSMS